MLAQREDCHEDEQHERAERRQDGERAILGIVGREIDGPERLREVAHVSEHHVARSHRQRNALDGGDRSSAKSAAANALGQKAFVIPCNTCSNNTELAAFSATFIRWCRPGEAPDNSTSSMCDSQVSGCQLPACPVWKAEAIDSSERPRSTWRFSNT